MTYPFRQPGYAIDRPEPLPSDFGEELSRLDALIGADAADVARDVPTDLGERLFAASVQHLPSARARKPALRFSQAPLLQSSLWSRLALAACVGIAFALAAVALYSPGRAPSGVPGFASSEGLSGEKPAIVHVVAERFEAPETLTPDEERLLLGTELAYLSDTRDLTLAEFAADVDSILRDLGG